MDQITATAPHHTTEQSGWYIGDGHVHIHDRFSLSTLFASTRDNCSLAARQLGLSGDCCTILLLTESAGSHYFKKLQDGSPAIRTSLGPYRVGSTDDPVCLRIYKEPDERLYLVAGRQIVTGERLEVLALGLDRLYPDGNPLSRVLAELEETVCLRVLPWGAGKWLGKRGGIMQSCITNWHRGVIYLGDNGNRPFFWPRPDIFRYAADKGICNLPGSDPLPFSDQEKRAGSFGFAVEAPFQSARPWSALLHALNAPNARIRTYGQPERLVPFLRNQLAMQFTKKKTLPTS